MIILQVTLGIIFLTIGCGIYLMYRSPSLNIYQWCMVLGIGDTIDSLRFIVQDWNLAEWVKYSLPDGLYCASYILIIDAIWKKDKCFIKFVIISLVPVTTISSELLQYFGLVKGTFDVCDLICYMIPPTIYYIHIYKSFMFNFLKIQQL